MGQKTILASVGFLLVGATLLFSTCRKDGGSDKDHGEADATALSGTWTSGCLADGVREGYAFQDKRVFSGTTFSTQFTSYSDQGCTQPVVTQEQVGAFKIGETVELGDKDGNQLDITIGSIFITLNTAATVQAYNDKAFCGGGWELGKKRQITKAECDGGAGDEVDEIFEIFALRSGQLYFGAKDAAHNGGGETTRPVALDESKPFKRG